MAIDKNPLTKLHMFATPEKEGEIEQFIDGLPKEYRGIGYTISAMTWNLAVAQVDEALYMKRKGKELADIVSKHYGG